MPAEPIYDKEISAQMALLCAITYVQLGEKQAQVHQLSYENIEPPELVAAKKAAIEGYSQPMAFMAHDTNWLWLAHRSDRSAKNIMQRLFWLSMELWARIALFIPLFTRKELFGFALEPASDDVPLKANILAFRGTSDTDEWLVDASLLQVPYGLKKQPLGNVHGGFASLYDEMIEDVMTTVKNFKDPSLPIYVTGHSLGAAIATLAAFNIAGTFPDRQVILYNYASPKVGDSTFAENYNNRVPASFRVVNLADIVPMMPPRDIKEGQKYQAVGQAYAYLDQTDNITENHSITKNYWNAVLKDIPTKAERDYPIKASH